MTPLQRRALFITVGSLVTLPAVPLLSRGLSEAETVL